MAYLNNYIFFFRCTLCVWYLLSFGCSVKAQEVYGYTSIEYSQNPVTVSVYAETDLDYSAAMYYLPCLTTSFSDSTNGNNLGYESNCAALPGNVNAEITFQASGTLGHSYYAQTQHYAGFAYKQGFGYFEDYYNFLSWPASQYANLNWEGEYEWFGPGPDQNASNPDQNLASTSSSASVVATGPCNDNRDQLIQEYKTYSVNLNPACSNFNKSASSQYFTNTQLTVNESPAYGWSLLTQVLLTEIDQWRTKYGSMTVNSAYRNPSHNSAVGGAANSRHMHGDAVDMNNPSKNSSGRTALIAALPTGSNAPDYIEPTTLACKLNCVHADWRNHSQAYAGP